MIPPTRQPFARKLVLTLGLALAGILGPAAPTRAAAVDQLALPPALSSEEELLDFLRTAEIVSAQPIGSGINGSLKLTLERDGVRAHAAFRSVEIRKENRPRPSVPDRFMFRDSYVFEVAAYELDRLLGLGRVPPTVLRSVDGVDGSVQLWVERATTEAKLAHEGTLTDNAANRHLQRLIMRAFDHLIYNFDRHQNNILFDADDRLWMIDHTRSFKRLPTLPDKFEVSLIDEPFYRALQDLSPERVRERLSPYLGKIEIEALLTRRRLLLERVERLVAERGASQVFYHYDRWLQSQTIQSAAVPTADPSASQDERAPASGMLVGSTFDLGPAVL